MQPDFNIQAHLEAATVGSKFEAPWSVQGFPSNPVVLHCVEATDKERRFSVFSRGVFIQEVVAVKSKGGTWAPKK